MINSEVYVVLFFGLLHVCNGATATIPIKRTTIRFKFDDWQLYNEYAGAFHQPEVCVSQILKVSAYRHS